MEVVFFSTKAYDRAYFEGANEGMGHRLRFLEVPLNRDTAVTASGAPVVCAFVNDQLDGEILKILADAGSRLIALRCAGYNNVDLERAAALGLKVVRVPAYSPHAVADHVFALLLTLVRKTHRAYNRVREGNFSLEGLIGYDLHGRTAGLVGTGKIGALTAERFLGFGCSVLACDPYPDEALQARGVRYVSLETLLAEADMVSLHCPLMKETHHLIDEAQLKRMKDGVTLINTSRGGLIDTDAVYRGLKSGKIGYLGLDVYEEEGPLFFEDHSASIIQDDLFMRLTTFPNVLITGHQGFLTDTALRNIASTTMESIEAFGKGEELAHEVRAE